MKKTILFLFLLVIIISGCEKDDFCIQNPVTPSLIISFYDDVNIETLKNVSSLSVWVEGKDSIYSENKTNSIKIPLNSLTTETNYKFSNGTDIATFTITYTPEEEYVSRSCGYKVNFNDVTFSADTTTWIKDFTPDTLTTIDNQTEAHVQIFH